jgi:hypothetical protein
MTGEQFDWRTIQMGNRTGAETQLQLQKERAEISTAKSKERDPRSQNIKI